MLTMEEIAGAVREAARDYPVRRVCLFGSYADGTATEHSDVDFYVEFSRAPISFYRVMGFRGALERLLGKEVDLVKHLPEDELDRVVCVYEA